jgi:surface protein
VKICLKPESTIRAVIGKNNMRTMFSNTYAFNQDISGWDVSNVTDMGRMFSYANAFNQDISSWNVGNVTDMSSMFQNATAFNQDISEWRAHVAETINHTDFSARDCPLTTENHPWESWDE